MPTVNPRINARKNVQCAPGLEPECAAQFEVPEREESPDWHADPAVAVAYEPEDGEAWFV